MEQEGFWETKDGVKIPFGEVTHQHWSNIYWYHRYIVERAEHNPLLATRDLIKHATHMFEFAEEQMKLRFAGEMLDWVPIYPNEKEWYAKQSTRKVLVEKYKEKIFLGAATIHLWD